MKINVILISLFLLIITIISEDNIPLYYIEPFKSIELENIPSAYICFNISEELEKGKEFYIDLATNESDVTINETLIYNYSNTYPEIPYIEYNNTKECNLSYDEDKFGYEYEFIKNDFKYLYIRYFNFTGKYLTINYSKTKFGVYFLLNLFIYILIVSLSTIIVLIIIKFCVINRIRRRKVEKKEFIAPIFPEDSEKEIKEIKSE